MTSLQLSENILTVFAFPATGATAALFLGNSGVRTALLATVQVASVDALANVSSQIGVLGSKVDNLNSSLIAVNESLILRLDNIAELLKGFCGIARTNKALCRRELKRDFANSVTVVVCSRSPVPIGTGTVYRVALDGLDKDFLLEDSGYKAMCFGSRGLLGKANIFVEDESAVCPTRRTSLTSCSPCPARPCPEHAALALHTARSRASLCTALPVDCLSISARASHAINDHSCCKKHNKAAHVEQSTCQSMSFSSSATIAQPAEQDKQERNGRLVTAQVFPYGRLAASARAALLDKRVRQLGAALQVAGRERRRAGRRTP